MKENRPRIQPILNLREKLLEAAGFVLLIGIWIWVLTSYSNLSSEIPVHFNASGEADNFGSKRTIFLLPVIATILFIALTIVNRYPYHFNYLTKITKDNALYQYTVATQMIRRLKALVLLIFGILIYMTIGYNDEGQGQDPWLLMISLGLVFVALGWFVYRSLKKT